MFSLIDLKKPPATISIFIYIYSISIYIVIYCQSNIHVKNIKHVEHVLAI